MSEIKQLLDAAAAGEPATAFDADALAKAGRRRRVRRQVAVAGSTGGVTALAAVFAVALVPQGDGSHRPTGQAAGGSPTVSSTLTASATPTPAATRGLTTESLPGLIEQDLGIRLSDVDVSVLPPVHDLDLGAGIASAKGEYLNVQVTPAKTESSTPPKCADIQGRGVDGDFYTGPCEVRPMSGGGFLVLRSGRTENGKYSITQANLVTADGAGIVAEASNQKFVPRKGQVNLKTLIAERDPVVSHNPPLTTVQLQHLVETLQTQR